MPRHHPGKSDPRRLAAMWLLKIQGATLTEIAAAFEISRARVGQIIQRVEHDIEAATRREIRRPTMAATQRLAAAGALPPHCRRRRASRGEGIGCDPAREPTRAELTTLTPPLGPAYRTRLTIGGRRP